MKLNILITGTAGFIGYHLAERLLKEGHRVTGLDQINDYYDVNLKLDRLRMHGVEAGGLKPGCYESSTHDNYRFVLADLQDGQTIMELFRENRFDAVLHMAAQAGVRYSLQHPQKYIDSNISGFLSILEACRHHPVEHLIYASSSSVYGLNTKMPFSVRHNVDHPISLYAATKKSNELMAHTYSHLFNIPATGLRFFTVYGPWGRPDMAPILFTRTILEGQPIKVFNHGEMKRDFTYIDDIVESIVRLLPLAPKGDESWDGENPDPSRARAPYRLFNIGYNQPVHLMKFISEIEKNLGTEAKKKMMEIQPGDVPATWADVSDLFDYIDYKPQVGIEEGVARFIEWYREYYRV